MNNKQMQDFNRFHSEFESESDRGAALIAASYLDERLKDLLMAFLADVEASHDLLSGYNAPLGNFSSRLKAAYSLGLIDKLEYEKINLIRKIRNKFGHTWENLRFEDSIIEKFAKKLPWAGPSEEENDATLKLRFEYSACILITHLMWREEKVQKDKREIKNWNNYPYIPQNS